MKILAGHNLSKMGNILAGHGLLNFSPASLFRDGSQGVWYDPSDLSTMFQDAQGQLPVTGPGDPVALVLDKSQGAGYSGGVFTGLGDELVTNGGFDTDSDWIKGTGWSISGGVATHIAGTGSSLDQDFSPAPQTILVTFNLTRSTGGFQLRYGDSTPQAVLVESNFHKIILHNYGDGILRLYGDSNFNGAVDNISVREIPGHHAVQDVNDDFRPELGNLSIEFDQIDDALTVMLPDLGTDATEFYADDTGVTISDGLTIGAGDRNLPTPDRLYAYGTLDRALTETEEDQLTAWLNSKRGA